MEVGLRPGWPVGKAIAFLYSLSSHMGNRPSAKTSAVGTVAERGT